MLALERGGRCAGMLFRIPAAEARDELLLAWRRELFSGAYRSRWVTAVTASGPVRAGDVRRQPGAQPLCGAPRGGAGRHAIWRRRRALSAVALTYLSETLGALRALGLRDRSLERLHRLVSEEGAT